MEMPQIKKIHNQTIARLNTISEEFSTAYEKAIKLLENTKQNILKEMADLIEQLNKRSVTGKILTVLNISGITALASVLVAVGQTWLALAIAIPGITINLKWEPEPHFYLYYWKGQIRIGFSTSPHIIPNLLKEGKDFKKKEEAKKAAEVLKEGEREIIDTIKEIHNAN